MSYSSVFTVQAQPLVLCHEKKNTDSAHIVGGVPCIVEQSVLGRPMRAVLLSPLNANLWEISLSKPIFPPLD